MSARCPACRAAAHDALAQHPEDPLPGGTQYSLYQCESCGLQFWDPRYVDASLYESGAYWGSTLMHLGVSGLHPYTARFFDTFPLRGGRILDVGCGDGAFLAWVAALGFEAWGIDIDARCIDVASRRTGVTAAMSLSLDKFADYAASQGLRFDAVTMFEVLEHQDEPVVFLRLAQGLLRNRGWLAGTVPNRRGAFNNFDRRYYFDSILPPHHFLWFDEESLAGVVTAAGFDRPEIEPSHFLSLNDIAAVTLAQLFPRLVARAKSAVRRRYLPEPPGGPGAGHIAGGVDGRERRRLVRRLRALTVARRSLHAALYPVAAARALGREPQGLYFQAQKPMNAAGALSSAVATATRGRDRQSVSIVLPCRNERRFIQACLESILANDHSDVEVIVVDGDSDDGTSEIVARYAEQDDRVRVIPNPRRLIPPALNLGFSLANGEYVLRVDAHAWYPPDFIAKSVRALKTSDCDVVGGRIITVPRTTGILADSVVAALSHPFGVGNSRFRIAGSRGRVDTVFSGCYRRDVLQRLLPLDERVSLSEDLLLHKRLVRAGGCIEFRPEIVSTYFARTDLRSFALHNWRNGVWALAPLRYGEFPASLRHLVPLLFVLGLVGSAAIAPITPWPLIGLLGAYALCVLAFSAHIAWRDRDARRLVTMPLVFAVLHGVYGTGSTWVLLSSLPGLIESWAIRRRRRRIE